MISRFFYNSANYAQYYLGGERKHYPKKDKAIVVKKYEYLLQEGEDFYTIAKNLFGAEKESMWTIIADINPLRHIDEWHGGDIIWLPEIIVSESLKK